jgi:adenylate cyclase
MSSRFWEGVERRHQPPRGAVMLEESGATARVPVYNGIASSINATVVAVLLFGFAEHLAGAVALTLVAAYVGAAGFYVVTGGTEAFVHLMVWSSLAQNVAIHVILGGFVWSGAFLMWGIIVATSAALFLSRKTALIVTGIYVTAAICLLFLEPWLRSRRSEPDPTLSALLTADVFVVSLLIVVPIVILLLRQIAAERQRAEALLLNLLPAPIATRLKRHPGVLAEEFEACTVLFADLVGFTAHSSSVTPDQLVAQLNVVFSHFDALVSDVGAEKIKTMGDGYLAVAGAPDRRTDHADVVCRLALGMQGAMADINQALETSFGLRVGMATGRLVAGVVGTNRFSYDLWGDTVNLASRMETLADPGTIRVTASVADAAATSYQFADGGRCDVKGVGPIPTFRLVGEKRPITSRY